jgi:hypothetical protein
MSHKRAIALTAKHQAESGEDHCLSGTCFTGENIESTAKFELGLLDNSEISNGNFF